MNSGEKTRNNMAIDAVITQLNTKALEKAVSEVGSEARPLDQGSSFKDVLGEIDTGEDFANQLGIQEQQENTPISQMQAMEGDTIGYQPTEDVAKVENPGTSEKVLDMLGEVNKGQMQMDSMVSHILYSGKKFSNQELLVIQAHVFHFAQMTELTVKVAEQGVSSVKNVLNTQVQ